MRQAIWPSARPGAICLESVVMPLQRKADMFAPLFRWLESRIDVFAPFNEQETPPRGVWPFMWHHIKGVRGWMALIMLTGLGFSGIEAAMYLMVGWFVDLLS